MAEDREEEEAAAVEKGSLNNLSHSGSHWTWQNSEMRYRF